MKNPSLPRQIVRELSETLSENPAVVLTGPRQAGKTTLALDVARELDGLYLDLESPSDRQRVGDIEAFCELHMGRLLIFDEIQQMPGLFAPLRGIIDRRRRAGHRTAQFLLLGSASLSLLRQSSESLAGRIGLLQLPPIQLSEICGTPELDVMRLWNRGGFPDSLLARHDAASLRWRANFISTYLERDIPDLGPRIPAQTLHRFWQMLAHLQGSVLNAASLSRSLDCSGVTIARYLDLLTDLLLVRKLPAWHLNAGKRLVKAPKVYIRDSGICHALLNIQTPDNLLGHPVCGGSWEGFVIEQVCNALPWGVEASYYRTQAGAEVDLVLDFALQGRWCIEIKASTTPALARGFREGCKDLQATRRIVVHSGQDSYPMRDGVEAMSIRTLLQNLAAVTPRTPPAATLPP